MHGLSCWYNAGLWTLVPILQRCSLDFQWAASEVLGGLVMMSALEGEPFFAVVKNVSIEFKRPARSGITTEAEFTQEAARKLRADFVRDGEAGFSLHVRVCDDKGVEVATATAEYLSRRPRGE